MSTHQEIINVKESYSAQTSPDILFPYVASIYRNSARTRISSKCRENGWCQTRAATDGQLLDVLNPAALLWQVWLPIVKLELRSERGKWGCEISSSMLVSWRQWLWWLLFILVKSQILEMEANRGIDRRMKQERLFPASLQSVEDFSW